MLLSLLEVLFALPVTLYQQITFLGQYSGALLPYTSWNDVHYGFATVLQIQASTFDTPQGHKIFAVLDLSRWVAPISAFICFA